MLTPILVLILGAVWNPIATGEAKTAIEQKSMKSPSKEREKRKREKPMNKNLLTHTTLKCREKSQNSQIQNRNPHNRQH